MPFAAAQCQDGDLRLTNTPPGTNSSGRLEICFNERWATVCGAQWTMPEASVACRQLGFSRYGEETKAALEAMVILFTP